MHAKRLGVFFVVIALVAGAPEAGGSDLEDLPEGWIASGSHPQDYEMGLDPKTAHNGKTSGTILSKPDKARGFGMLMQLLRADKYRGKRLLFSGYVKTRNVKQWAGLWMRVDGERYKPLAFDNMQDRPISGDTEWKKFIIVLDVPKNAITIGFGVLLMGAGQVWADDFKFETVGLNVTVTDLLATQATPPEAARPRGVGFEK
jgi:hypothetical protein